MATIDSAYAVQDKSSIRVINEPDDYQITNYNIQPSLAIELSQDLEQETIVKAELVLNSKIENGFQAGSTQVMSRNSR